MVQSNKIRVHVFIYLFIILLIAREFELRVFIFNLPELI